MILTAIEIRDAIIMALSSIMSNKLRAGLTILGVMIGVSSVISLASVIEGLDAALEKEIDGMGSNSILITKLPINVDRHNLGEDERNRPPITIGEARAIQDNCPSIDGISPQNYYFQPGGNEIKYKNRKANRPSLMGTWPDYVRVNGTGIEQGRFLSYIDEQFRSFVCVLGHDLAKTLFLQENPVGRTIRINGKQFEVIGVFEKRESNFDSDRENRVVVIPLSTFEKLYPWEEALFLMAKAESYEKLEQAQEEIISTLRMYRKVPFNKPNSFEISTQDNLKDFVGNMTKYLYMAMMTITSVGLMVGGIGVMNIMLVSVTERTREIGVRKAVGAKKLNIILQFLIEAMTLTAAGGLVGIVFGQIVGTIINSMAGFPGVVSVSWILIGFFVAVSVGMVSGLYPAIKASRLDPIEALRYE